MARTHTNTAARAINRVAVLLEPLDVDERRDVLGCMPGTAAKMKAHVQVAAELEKLTVPDRATVLDFFAAQLREEESASSGGAGERTHGAA